MIKHTSKLDYHKQLRDQHIAAQSRHINKLVGFNERCSQISFKLMDGEPSKHILEYYDSLYNGTLMLINQHENIILDTEKLIKTLENKS